MLSPFRTKEFRAIQKYWYARLKKEGFKDAELRRYNTDVLKSWDSTRFQLYYTPTQFAIRQLYFELTGQFLHSHKFKNPSEKAIWALHCTGVSYRTIAATLGIPLRRVERTIPELRTIMLEEAKRGK